MLSLSLENKLISIIMWIFKNEGEREQPRRTSLLIMNSDERSP